MQEARIKQRVMQLVREADDDGDWQAAGCKLERAVVRTGLEQRLPHRQADHAYEQCAAQPARARPRARQGALSLDQVAAAAEFATPETDAELARVAVDKAPSEIALAARTLVPPSVADDQELYRRRALSMVWTRGRRELAVSGRLPLEQGAAFEQAIWNIAKTQRALDKQAGVVLDWQQSAADALVTLATRAVAKTTASGGARRR